MGYESSALTLRRRFTSALAAFKGLENALPVLPPLLMSACRTAFSTVLTVLTTWASFLQLRLLTWNDIHIEVEKQLSARVTAKKMWARKMFIQWIKQCLRIECTGHVRVRGKHMAVRWAHLELQYVRAS